MDYVDIKCKENAELDISRHRKKKPKNKKKKSKSQNKINKDNK